MEWDAHTILAGNQMQRCFEDQDVGGGIILKRSEKGKTGRNSFGLEYGKVAGSR
jgi:hypothetical protein